MSAPFGRVGPPADLPVHRRLHELDLLFLRQATRRSDQPLHRRVARRVLARIVPAVGIARQAHRDGGRAEQVRSGGRKIAGDDDRRRRFRSRRRVKRQAAASPHEPGNARERAKTFLLFHVPLPQPKRLLR